MKKKLLILFCGIAISVNAQTLESEDFNTLTIGNVGTDIGGSTSGQGTWYTYSANGTGTSTNAANSNFQIVASGMGGSNGLQLTGADGDSGSRYMWLNGFATAWSGRAMGNDIVEVEYDFYTGSSSTSTTRAGMQLYDSSYNTLNGFVYNMDTNILQGLAYLNNGGTPGHFLIDLGPSNTDLVLTADTWYRVGFGYDSITGQPYWKVGSDPTVTLDMAFWQAPTDIIEIDFAQETPSTNTSVSTIVFDNYISRATNMDTLLSEDTIVNKPNTLVFYPNPVNNILNVNSELVNIESISITDLNGRVVKQVELNKTFSQINVSELNSGVYLLNIKTEKGNEVKKFIKN